MIEKLRAKLEKPPIARTSSWAYPSRESAPASLASPLNRPRSGLRLGVVPLVAHVRPILVEVRNEDEEHPDAGHEQGEEAEVLGAHELVGRDRRLAAVECTDARDRLL